MAKVEANISMSLDGFVTGPNLNRYPGLGEGGDILHACVDESRSMDFAIGEERQIAGSVITSRRVYDETAARAGSGSPWRVLQGRRSDRGYLVSAVRVLLVELLAVSEGLGPSARLLDLADRPLLVAVLDPAGAAAAADGGRVQTEGDSDQGRSAQRTAGHENLTDGRRALVVIGIEGCWRAG